MIKRNNLLKEKKDLDSRIKELLQENIELAISVVQGRLAEKYYQRANVNINLYLTDYVLKKDTGLAIDDIAHYYESAIYDYKKAIELFNAINESFLCAEAILAYGNAIKEGYLPSNRDKGELFTQFFTDAKRVYKHCIKYTLNINYLRYHYFTMLEQMNLEVRKKYGNKKSSDQREWLFFIH